MMHSVRVGFSSARSAGGYNRLAACKSTWAPATEVNMLVPRPGSRATSSLGVIGLCGAQGNQRLDLLRAVPNLGEDLGGLLAEERRRQAGTHRLAVEVVRSAGYSQRADPRMLDFQDEILGTRLAVVHRLRHIVDRAAGNSRLIEAAHHLLGGERFQPRLQTRAEPLAVGRATGVCGETLFVQEGYEIECGAEALPERVVAHGDIHIAVGSGEGVVGSDHRVGVPELPGGRADGEVESGLVGKQSHLATKHRDVDVAPLAAALAVEERGDDGVGGEHAPADVRDRYPEPSRRAARVPGDAHYAAGALHDEVVCRALVVGAGLPESGDGGVDDLRATRLDRVVAEPKSSERAGRTVLDEDVGPVDQAPERVVGGVMFEVEGDRAFVAVDREIVDGLGVDEGRSPVAGVVTTAGDLDLHYVRAEVPEHHRAVGPDHNAGQIDDLNPG